MILLEYLFAFGNRADDNHRAVAIQNSNRLVHVGERNFYLGSAFCEPDFFGASFLRDVHADEDLRHNLCAVLRHVLGN